MTVIEIKASIFDILATQENLQNQIKQLDQMKQGKLQELQQAVASEVSSATTD